MAKYKAALIILVRKLMREHGEITEKEFLARLTPDDLRAYNTSIQVTWLPVEQATRILAIAADVLFPNDPLSLRKLGREEAKDNLTGIYKILLNLMSISAMIEQSPRMWRMYHDQGQAHTERNGNDHKGAVVVEGYPELPEANREIFAGFLEQVMKKANLKNAQVTRDDVNPNAWKWIITWP